MMAIDLRGMTPLIQVFNMPRALAFYRDLLGFEIHADSGNGDDSSWIWLRRGEIDLMLNDQYEPGRVLLEPPVERIRWHDDTCLYFGCPDVDGLYEFLKSKGVDPEPPKAAPYGMYQLYVSDPDGYNVCFQWPIPEAENQNQ
jgi:glyoxylase I family protein